MRCLWRHVDESREIYQQDFSHWNFMNSPIRARIFIVFFTLRFFLRFYHTNNIKYIIQSFQLFQPISCSILDRLKLKADGFWCWWYFASSFLTHARGRGKTRASIAERERTWLEIFQRSLAFLSIFFSSTARHIISFTSQQLNLRVHILPRDVGGAIRKCTKDGGGKTRKTHL